MPVSVTCTCGKKLKAKDEAAGKTGRCPACGQSVTFPVTEPLEIKADSSHTNGDNRKQLHSPAETASGNGRFFAIVAIVALVLLVGGITLVNRVINNRQISEASALLRQSLTETIEKANGDILKSDFGKAADALRHVVQPKPSIEKGDQNEVLYVEAEALLKASEIATSDARLVEYLSSLDDERLNRITVGEFELLSPISDSRVKKAVQKHFAKPISSIQARRKQLAQQQHDQRLALDPLHQKNLFLARTEKQKGEILERDGILRGEIASMERDYRSSLFKPLTTRGIENVLDEWGDKREKMLEARTEEIGETLQAFVQEAMKHQVWRCGAEQDQLRLAKEFGTTLKNMVALLEKPVDNQLASFERTFGDKVHRGFRQLDDLNAKMRDFTKAYDNAIKGRLR